MPEKNPILNWGPFSRVRHNHALEHATLQVLAEKIPGLKLAGYSDARGFWLIGQVETRQVDQAVHEALTRMRAGEHNLAIHPNCGTNLVTSGFLAGTAAWLGMLGAGRSTRERFERLPLIMSLVTVAMILAQPVGPYLQARVTTSPPIEGGEVTSIERSMRGDVPLHRVLTRY